MKMENKKMMGILVCAVLITAVFPVMGMMNAELENDRGNCVCDNDGLPAHGDWEITNGEYYFDRTMMLDGNLTIKNGGSLILYQVKLKMVSAYPGQHHIKVERGGKLSIDKSFIKSSSNHCWRTRIGVNNALTSPIFNLSKVSSAHLSFWHQYLPKSVPGSVEISNGRTWNTLSFNPGNPGKWNFVNIDITQYASEKIILRFRCSASWYIDDVSIPEIEYSNNVEDGPMDWEAVGWHIVEYPSDNPYLFIVEKNGEIEIEDSKISGCGYEENPPIYDHSGIWINTDGAVIENSMISDCFGGVVLYESGHNRISKTDFMKNNGTSLILSKCYRNVVEECRIFNNSGNGLGIHNSSYNKIKECEIYRNKGWGIMISDYSTKNNLTECDVHYNEGDGIKFLRCDQIEIDGNDGIFPFNNSGDGIELSHCSNIKISRLTTIGNGESGIRIINSSNIHAVNCNISSNGYGIWVTDNSNGNHFHYNNLIDNLVQGWDECNNSWDNGSVGNYWSDYTGSDANGDGIGDQPYSIPSGKNKDRYPLMEPVGVDTTPPIVSIERPRKGYLYINDREIMPIPITIIISGITIDVEAVDVISGVDKVEFYIDGKLKYADEEKPYEWLWDETAIGCHIIKVRAYDFPGNTASDEMKVTIFNI